MVRLLLDSHCAFQHLQLWTSFVADPEMLAQVTPWCGFPLSSQRPRLLISSKSVSQTSRWLWLAGWWGARRAQEGQCCTTYIRMGTSGVFFSVTSSYNNNVQCSRREEKREPKRSYEVRRLCGDMGVISRPEVMTLLELDDRISRDFVQSFTYCLSFSLFLFFFSTEAFVLGFQILTRRHLVP